VGLGWECGQDLSKVLEEQEKKKELNFLHVLFSTL